MLNKVICIFTVTISLICIAETRVVKRHHSNETLELVHVLFRHGDRTPDKHTIYPNDPYINETYYPVGHGQLTNAGKRKEYFLGKALRKRYGKRFLGDFTLEEVDARSTDYNRTKMSLHLVLASLFPAEGPQVWAKGINWQPVPFNYWPVQDDHVIGDPYKNCPKYKEIYYKYINSTDGIEAYREHEELFKYLSAYTGLQISGKTAAELYFTLTTEIENGFESPYWAQPLYQKTKTLAILDYNTSTATESLRRLSSGFLVKKIIDDTEAKINGQLKNTKIFLYSAHEFNIAYLLRYLGIYYPHIPPYGGYILIEVHNNNGARGIKIYYQDYVYGKPRKLKLPNCSNVCPLKKFKANYKKLLPESTMECY